MVRHIAQWGSAALRDPHTRVTSHEWGILASQHPHLRDMPRHRGTAIDAYRPGNEPKTRQ